MTLTEHVYAIQQNLARGRTSSDKDYSNRFITHYIKLYRSLLLTRKLNKGDYVSPTNSVTICMPLVQAQFADCPGCELPVTDCYFYRSVAKLPSAVMCRKKSPYIIRLIDGTILPMMTVLNSRYVGYSGVDDINKGWFISNGHLFIIWPKDKNHMPIEMVLIEFIPEDPEEVNSLSPCSDSSEDEACINTQSDEFFIDPELVPVLYDMILKRLIDNYGLPQDDLGNSRSADIQPDVE